MVPIFPSSKLNYTRCYSYLCTNQFPSYHCMIPNLGVDNVTNLLALRLVEASEGKFSLEEIFRSSGWVTCYPAGPLAPPWPADSSEKWSAEMSSTDVGGHTWSWRPSPRGMIPPSILAPEARRQISVRISDTWHEAINYNNNVIFKPRQIACHYLAMMSRPVFPSYNFNLWDL